LLDRSPPPVPRNEERWIHGDFHADQMLVDQENGRVRLIDLDALRPGECAEDLASWIADRLSLRPDASIDEACHELCLGYAEGGGRLPSRARIDALVADELVLRAAAALRRLEQGALEKAARCLDRARSLAANGRDRS
jgi:aminoglycoside phosphotransferase (APT) family kinase protein